jgi:hypothetical protein
LNYLMLKKFHGLITLNRVFSVSCLEFERKWDSIV